MNISVPRRKLGSTLEVSALGLGCMGMSWGYGVAADDAESVRVIDCALDLGIDFLDTAEIYGPHTNETLVGKAVKGRRNRFTIATKFGFKLVNGTKRDGVDSSPANVRRACEGSLKRLGVDHIDLFYQHRVDPSIAIEETVGAMSDLVREGKVRFLGLSEAGASTIRRAHAVHPIAALQSEYSLWERGIEDEILPTCRELGIGCVPFSPLGRGFLTATLTDSKTLAADDFRRSLPKFSEENFDRNLELLEVVRRVAARHETTPARIALAWILAQGDDLVSIPGTKRVAYLNDNAGAVTVKLLPTDLEELGALAGQSAGERYNAEGLRMVRI